MSDDALIRLSNLKATGVTAKQLEAVKVGRYTYCRDLLAGQKSFGEKAARKIEEKMGWPRGCLDTDEGCNLHSSSGQSSSAREPLRRDTEEPNSTIPTAVTYSPSNLKTTILLLGNLLGALDKRSREIIGSMLKDLALHTDDAQDIADKAAALATTQQPVSKNKELNKAITTPSKLAETRPAELERSKRR
jgi:hypothetical protein